MEDNLGKLKLVDKDRFENFDFNFHICDIKKVDSYIYSCKINEQSIERRCLLMRKGKRTNHWCDFAQTFPSRYMLNVIDPHPIEDFKDSVLVVTEYFDHTLASWPGSLTANSFRFAPEFATILRDTVEGLLHLHSCGIAHNKVDASSIYIVGGRAKLGRVIPAPRGKEKTLCDDLDDLCEVVEGLFVKKKEHLSFDTSHFLGLLRESGRKSVEKVKYVMDHVALAPPWGRNIFRMMGWLNARYVGKGTVISKGAFRRLGKHVEMSKETLQTDWKNRVKTNSTITKLNTWITVGDDAEGFVDMSRNYCQHVYQCVSSRQNSPSEEAMDSELSKIWPGFLCFWFETCYDNDIFLPPLRR